MTLVFALYILVAFWSVWYAFVYAPRQLHRQNCLDLLTNSIEICFADSSPGEHLAVGEECYMLHDCSETDDLSALNLHALHWVQDLADSLPQGAQYRLHWAKRPTYHVCNDHGTRKTCLILRFFLHRIPEDPHA